MVILRQSFQIKVTLTCWLFSLVNSPFNITSDPFKYAISNPQPNEELNKIDGKLDWANIETFYCICNTLQYYNFSVYHTRSHIRIGIINNIFDHSPYKGLHNCFTPNKHPK